MAYLTIYTDGVAPERLLATSDEAEISSALAPIGVEYGVWPVDNQLAETASADEVLAAYGDAIEQVKGERGYVTVDVASLHPSDDPAWEQTATAARAKFLAEHTHTDDEVRLFTAGSGIFYLHVQDKVYAVLGETGDFLSVPAGTTHWFDMGTRPSFTAVRFFKDDEGWVGDFTGDPIAERIPDFDTIVAARAAVAS